MAAARAVATDLSCTPGRVRVLQIMEATIGGTKRHLYDLVTHLDPAHFDVEVACPRRRSEPHGDTSFVDDLRAAAVTVRPIPMVRALRPVADGRSIVALAALIRRGRFDLVHTHSTKAGLLGRLAARARPATRVVHSPHGFYFLNFEAPWPRAAYRAMERGLGRLTHRLIALSTGEQALAATVVAPAKVRLIPNSFERFTPLPAAEARVRLGLPPAAPVVGTTARFTRQKAPFDIVEAFAAIHQAQPDVRFVWINDGELRAAVLRRLAERGLLEATALPGYVPNARELLPAMDVFLHLARWEGIPYAVMEAMTAGVPVVGAAAIGTSDLIEDRVTGRLIPPGDPAAAARAAVELLTHPTKARTIRAAAERSVAKHHDPAAMVRATEQVYFELIRRS